MSEAPSVPMWDRATWKAVPVTVEHLVGPGWFDLIRRLDEQLQASDPDYYATQVKEKFGGLRFYTGSLSGEGYAAVGAAEGASFTICEECGEPGYLDDDGGYWVKTLCEDHHVKRYRDQMERK